MPSTVVDFAVNDVGGGGGGGIGSGVLFLLQAANERTAEKNKKYGSMSLCMIVINAEYFVTVQGMPSLISHCSIKL